MNIHAAPLRDSLAAEYVLGALHGAARRRFERLLAAHPALQRAVAEWERRLNRLAVASLSVAPPPQVWRDLERRLFPAPARRPWWDSLALWRGLALAGVLAAVIALAPPLAQPPEQDLTFAAIRGKQQQVLWTVARAADGRLHVSNLRTPAIPLDQHCLLWLKTGDGPPVMVGALPEDGSVRTLPMPAGVTSPGRGELWVTMQPVAAAPQLPTQPLFQTRWQAL